MRAIRRLLLAVGIWAVGASIVAVIALVEEDPPPPQRTGDLELTSRIADLERTLERRISALEERMGGVATAEEIERLTRDVRRARRETASAAEAAGELREDLDALEERLQQLEGRVEENEGTAGDEDQGSP